MQQSKSQPHFYKAVEVAKYFFLAFLAILFLVQLVLSSAWRLDIDASFMHYVAYLINEHGFVPYRDIFEPNMPVTYLFHMAVGKMFGYSDLAFRMVDFAWLSATFTVTWFVMRPVGRITALASCLLFGLVYLKPGSFMSLQRDAIAILPMATAVLLTTRCSPWRSLNLTNFLVGALFAVAALIKPHLVIGLPAIVIYHSIYGTHGSKSPKTLIKTCTMGSLFALLGFFSTLTIPFLWLWRIGAIQSFWGLFFSFLPLYSQMSGNLEVQGTIHRLIFDIESYLRFGGLGVLFVGSMVGVFEVWREHSPPATRKLAVLLFSLTILYTIYVAIGGKFWAYHWMPSIYFASLCTALILSPPSLASLRFPRSFFSLLLFVLITVLTVQLSTLPFRQLIKGPPFPVSTRRIEEVDEIAAYLKENLLPTDKVQPLDSGGGTLHAMLISKAVLATPYIVDFQFYHHVSTPYIQNLRKDFIERLEQDIPAFIIDVDGKVRVSGIDTDYRFPALERFIQQHYTLDYKSNDFEIFRKRN